MVLIIREQIYLLVILLGFSAFFSMAETALVGVSKLRVMHLVEKKIRGAAILLQLKETPQTFLTTLLVFNNLVNVGASALATMLAISVFENNAIGIATGGMTLLILIFGEIGPKSLGSAYKEHIALSIAQPIAWLATMIAPIVWIFEKLTNVLTKNAKRRPSVTEEEIETIIRVGHEEGELDHNEKVMIQRIFKFDDLNVRQVMTPVSDITSIEESEKIKDLRLLLKENPYSRIPVYKKEKGNITGVIFTKDLINQKSENKLVKSIMERVNFVPETTKLDTLLLQCKKKQQSIAMAVDEHGTLVGLVTINDLLDEIIGEFEDEKEKVEPNIRKRGNKWFVEGKTEIPEVNARLRSRFQDRDEYETFGGLILHQISRIPKLKETIKINNYLVTIEEMQGKRITQVMIERLNKQKENITKKQRNNKRK
ncbi:MAG: hemolysin family protein [Nanoarchaeota archaeon]|nr:hemolysin family protein [Nanoarchaeota archaeon]